jgi:hypothetical protein
MVTDAAIGGRPAPASTRASTIGTDEFACGQAKKWTDWARILSGFTGAVRGDGRRTQRTHLSVSRSWLHAPQLVEANRSLAGPARDPKRLLPALLDLGRMRGVGLGADSSGVFGGFRPRCLRLPCRSMSEAIAVLAR